MKKFLKLAIPVFFCVMLIMTSVMAFGEINTDKAITDFKDNSGAAETANTIIGAVQWIGYAIAVGMLVFVGIKYILASANEKADLKNALIHYVIGAILIAGAVTVAGWIFAIM